jgi:hypothetical protein
MHYSCIQSFLTDHHIPTRHTMTPSRFILDSDGTLYELTEEDRRLLAAPASYHVGGQAALHSQLFWLWGIMTNIQSSTL